MPRLATSRAESGVMSTPPVESPVVASASAKPRRRENHRVTSVVPGSSELQAKPTPNTR